MDGIVSTFTGITLMCGIVGSILKFRQNYDLNVAWIGFIILLTVF